MPDPNASTPAAARLPQEQIATGLSFRIARNLEEVTAAWRMVYMAYRRAGLIESNPYRIHTAPQAIGRHVAVIGACMGPITVSTLTAFADNANALPLDRVYQMELTELRQQGRRLMEVGLFADRRIQISRTAEALFQLMRYAFYYALQCEVTDFVIGVHPRHARFYTRAFGFEPMGALKNYPAVNNRPVVLLRGDLEDKLKLRPLHPALDYFVKNPVTPENFESRYPFPAAELAASDLGRFLAARQENLGLSKSA